MRQKYISIMGDSISTYSGYNPKGYAVYYDIFAKTANRMRSVRDCWWWIVLKDLHAKLWVNGSFSGSLVSGGYFPAAESRERIEILHKKNVMPDLILIYIGFNDFASAVGITTFTKAYERMLEQLKQCYPESGIFCGTLMCSYIHKLPQWEFPEINRGVRIGDYNEAIRVVSRNIGVQLVDLAGRDIRYETLDGTHPTVTGHAEIAKAWNMCLNELL